MNIGFDSTAEGQFIINKLTEYEQNNDPAALKQKDLISKALFVAQVVISLGFFIGCAASAITLSPITFVASFGIFAPAYVIFSVFYNVMNAHEFESYKRLKEIRDNWGQPSGDFALRVLSRESKFRLEDIRNLNAKDDSSLNIWLNTLKLNIISESFQTSKFLGISADKLQQDLLNLQNLRQATQET